MVVASKNAAIRKHQPLKKIPKGIIPVVVRNPIPEEKMANGVLSGSKIHAQRKFAQGVTVRGTGCSPLKLSKAGQKKKADKPPISPTLCAPPLKRPKTEDFVAFLCYRSTPVLPQELDFFNYPQTESTVEKLTKAGTSQEDCHKNEESTEKDVTFIVDAVIRSNTAAGPSSVAKSKGTPASGGTLSKMTVTNEKKIQKPTTTLKKCPNVMVLVKQAEKAVAAMNKEVKKDLSLDIPPPAPPTRINEQDARFAMTALKLKYQEKRLAKPTINVVSKITKKVKERNVILTRSKASSQDEDEKRTSPRPKNVAKNIIAKHRVQKDIRPRSRNAPSPDIIYGVIHSKNIAKKIPSPDSSRDSSSSSSSSSKSNSSSSEEESETEETPVVRSLRNGKQFVTKTQEKKLPRVQKSTPRKISKTPQRISTRSSHRKSTSPLRELPMYSVKKRKIKRNKSSNKSINKKKSVETSKSKDEPKQTSHRPTRKTKETASIYLGLINTFSSDEEDDTRGKNKNQDESSGDSSSSETKYIEKQYNASIKRVEQNNQSSTGKASKKSSSTSNAATKIKSKKDMTIIKSGVGKGKNLSKTTKVLPAKRVLRQSSRTKSFTAILPRRIGTRRLTTPVATCDRRRSSVEGAARKSATLFPKKRKTSTATPSQSSSSSETESESDQKESEDTSSNNKASTKKVKSNSTPKGKGITPIRKVTTKTSQAKPRATDQPSVARNNKESTKLSKVFSSDDDDDEDNVDEEEEEEEEKNIKTENLTVTTGEDDGEASETKSQILRLVEIHHATPSTSSSSSSNSSSGENFDEDVSSDDEPKPIVGKTSIAIQVDMDMEENIYDGGNNVHTEMNINDMYPPMPLPPTLSSSQHNLTHASMVNNFMPAINMSHTSHPPAPPPFASAPSFYPTLHLTPPVVSNIQLLARGAQGQDQQLLQQFHSFNHPGITMNIPVSVPMHGYSGQLLQPSAMCFSSTSISAATLQTHIRSSNSATYIPLVRPIVGAENSMSMPSVSSSMMNAANCSTAMTRPLNFWSNNNTNSYAPRTAHTSAFRVPIPGKPMQSSLMVNPNHSMLPLSVVHPQQQQQQLDTQQQHPQSSTSENTQIRLSTSSGYPILQSLPTLPTKPNFSDHPISIVPKFNRNSKPVVLPDDQEALERQIKQSNKEASSSAKGSKGGNEEKKDKESKKSRKSFVIPKPTSPLTVRKDSTTPKIYARGSKSNGSEQVKEPKADSFLKLLQMKNSSSSTTMETSTNPPSSSSPRPSSSKESNNKSEASDSRTSERSNETPPDADANSGFQSAPTFYPDDEQFSNPLKYIEQIRAEAERFGIARIVPPRSFRPDCNVDDGMRFTAYNHYIHKMFQRWGHNVHETMAIKEHLRKSDVDSSSVPMIGGMEIDLCTLYHTVQSFGGLKETIEKQKWNKVSDAMHIPKAANDRASKLDSVYVKYVLPYEMLSDNERKRLLNKVERHWNARQEKLRKKSMNSDSESDKDSVEEEDDCIIKGKSTPLSSYFRVARNTRSMLFQDKEPTCNEVEKEYWKIVRKRTRHLCVYSGSIDCAGVGWGFPLPKASNKHPWNLKVLANSPGSILRSMGPVMGATVPTLHVGMVFTTYCWYRDPHGLPWVEYLHSGGNKIWYAIPASEQDKFREALKDLMPMQCKNKKIWLASDSAMVPPELLQEKGISLFRAVQNAGEFLVVFPKAFTSAICTSYVISESVCFAPPEWLSTATETFDDIKTSKEPPVFPLERLLLSIIQDNKNSTEVLRLAISPMEKILKDEFALRHKLIQMGIHTGSLVTKASTDKTTKKKEKKEDEVQQCDNCNYILHLSLVNNETHEFTYCLAHAVEYLQKHKSHIKSSVLRYDHSQEELEEMMEELANRLS